MKLLWDAKHYILEGGKKSSPPQSQLTDEWTNKNMVYPYNEIFFALKKEGNSDTFSSTDQREDVLLSEISQLQQYKYCLILLVWGT